MACAAVMRHPPIINPVAKKWVSPFAFLYPNNPMPLWKYLSILSRGINCNLMFSYYPDCVFAPIIL